MCRYLKTASWCTTSRLSRIRSYCKQQIDTLWDEVLRFENPHNYYVDLSRKLWDIKHELLDNGGVLRARDGRERS